MTSLAEAYEENVGEVANPRRLYLGVGLFAVGALLVVLAIVMATTGIHAAFGLEYWQGREIAGILAGLGVPAVFVGIFSVLPASERVRAAATIGAGIAMLGVALFAYAYPYWWAGVGEGPDYTFQVVAVYFVGVIVTFWCLFVAVANFKTRNDPGGTVTLEITREGEVHTVEVSKGDLEDFEDLDRLTGMHTELGDSGSEPTGLGGVGFFGEVPDGETPTQTAGRGPGPGHATSDGGTTTNDIRSPLDDPDADPLPRQGTTDAYCGNCRHFRYVRTSDGMQPHCGYYSRTMQDMDACDEWEPNS
ncbi:MULTISPECIES: Yip1 family protein [Halorussus]|uniref:Yip1 family protein n=1 Tax=Halorussus TaxID=1070314 RepID=UPI00209DD657|nr:Yip1 family protein [Halorussus vallis]USZ75382.1 hypothetical protein NGM07_18355 [Halorussus vallis]